MFNSGLSAIDLASIASAITEGLNILPQTITLNTDFSEKDLSVVYGASTLLAVSSTSLSTRKCLIVVNYGPVRIRVGKTSADAIYEKGVPVEPGEVKVFEQTTVTDLYARSAGHASKVKVIEC